MGNGMAPRFLSEIRIVGDTRPQYRYGLRDLEARSGLERALHSLRAHESFSRMEIIIVDCSAPAHVI